MVFVGTLNKQVGAGPS